MTTERPTPMADAADGGLASGTSSSGEADGPPASSAGPQAPTPSDMSAGPPVRVLVVDDERLSRESAVRQLRHAGYDAKAVENGYEALDSLKTERWDVVLSDLRMPGLDGMELLQTITHEHPGVDVVVMTAYGTVQTAVAAIQNGAADYLTKPFRFQEFEHRLRKLMELRAFRTELYGLRALLADAEDGMCGIVGRSPRMRTVVQQIETFAAHLAPVLITGETGCGKEMVARALHQRSGRAAKPFVAVACGAIPTELAESELFGHEKGSFTGATGQRQGAFERANGGTLLLDDVDDLPLVLQVKLLRALEQQSFARVGGSREIGVDVRVVATTKLDLASAAAARAFRQDLYYRLRALEIRLPPLRERGEDILLLAEHFLRVFAAQHKRPEIQLSPEAAACMRRYPWPGNVRELRHTIQSAVIVSTTGTLGPDCLPEFVSAMPAHPSADIFTMHIQGQRRIVFAEAVRSFEDQLVHWAMREAGGHQNRAAELLSMARTTFQGKLNRRPSGSEPPVPSSAPAALDAQPSDAETPPSGRPAPDASSRG